jgi:hypothetical protein
MEPVIGSARLFTAFESAGLSPGAELRNAFGPSGSPAESVVRAFEDAMESPGNIPGMDMPGRVSAYDAGPDFLRSAEAANEGASLAVPAPGPAEYMPPQGNSMFRAEGAARPGVSARSAPGAELGSGPLQSPVELYQAQYQIGLLRAHMNVMMQSSQSLTQSLETALKQSG